MKSFRTELENPVVEKDILDLEKKIHLFREGKIESEKFRSLRLVRGVYGQRQQGVQMVRIKIPLGKITTAQLLRIAEISDEYSNGNLHLTTRQDIQLHFVSLEKTPELWAKLEKDDLTLREACGNTVRNITASAMAGIDPKEPFDVTPYAEAMFRFFLRNPVQQDLGRKFKIAFSSSEEDTAFTFIHDLGFIPKVKIINGKIVRGFKVLIGGGLGAQPFLGQTAYEFLPDNKVISFAESVIRVFDRYGERNNRHKARLKYLIAKIGLHAFLKLTEKEKPALRAKLLVVKTDFPVYDFHNKKERGKIFTTLKISDTKKYQQWLVANVREQKQQGFFAVGVRIPLGNIRSDRVRKFAEVVKKHAADELRITVNQGFLLRFIPKEALPALFRELDVLNLAQAGFDSTADITACPGTDTCNLSISNSTGIAMELEKVIQQEYADLIYEKNIKIKISGCMNSCGHHALAHIGFHGSSFKAGKQVVPALQVLLGGGVTGNGSGRISDKIIKIPSKRGPAVLRAILDDYEKNSEKPESFHNYFDRKGNQYFYELLKEHSDLSTLADDEYKDWGYDEYFKPEIGTGECAGVKIDLVATLFLEAEEKLDWAKTSLEENLFADSIYHSYSAFIHAAKAMLLTKEVHVNSQYSVLNEFEKHFVETKEFSFGNGFKELVLQINKTEPAKVFAEFYSAQADAFVKKIKAYRESQKEKLITA